jgi:hypothetical protein
VVWLWVQRRVDLDAGVTEAGVCKAENAFKGTATALGE